MRLARKGIKTSAHNLLPFLYFELLQDYDSDLSNAPLPFLRLIVLEGAFFWEGGGGAGR